MTEVTAAEAPGEGHDGSGALDKGLKTGALGFVSSVVIGVASTAPGYSLAASLGVVAAAVGFQSPAGAILGSVVLKLVQRSTVPLLVVPVQES